MNTRCICCLFNKLVSGETVTVTLKEPSNTLTFEFIAFHQPTIIGVSGQGLVQLDCRKITSVFIGSGEVGPAPNPNCALRTCAANGACDGRFPCPPPSGQIIPVPSGGSIQAAINAANTGDQIIVAPGTYTEQLVIPAGKDNISITSQVSQSAIITSPPAGLSGNLSLITVNGQCTVIDGFTITGPSVSPGNLLNGILVSGGTAEITNNLIEDIRDEPLQPSLQGTGVNVASGAARVAGNTILRYGRTGIRVNGTGTCGTIVDNAVTGVGPTTVQAQNGIQISRGATAVVQDNTITGNEYTGIEPASSTGILLFETVETAPVCVLSNTLSLNDVGLALASSSGTLIQTNNSSNNTQIGINTDENSANNVFVQNTALNDTDFGIADFSTGSSSAFTANTYLCNTCSSDNRNGEICASTSSVPVGRNIPPNGASPVVIPD